MAQAHFTEMVIKNVILSKLVTGRLQALVLGHKRKGRQFLMCFLFTYLLTFLRSFNVFLFS